jgi:hypothetical protein
MRRIQIDRGTIRLRPEGGVLKIAEATFVGQEVRVDLLGQFWFDLRQKIDLQLGLAPAIEARLQKRGIPTQHLNDPATTSCYSHRPVAARSRNRW